MQRLSKRPSHLGRKCTLREGSLQATWPCFFNVFSILSEELPVFQSLLIPSLRSLGFSRDILGRSWLYHIWCEVCTKFLWHCAELRSIDDLCTSATWWWYNCLLQTTCISIQPCITFTFALSKLSNLKLRSPGKLKWNWIMFNIVLKLNVLVSLSTCLWFYDTLNSIYMIYIYIYIIANPNE